VRWSKLIATINHIDETGIIYLVSADGIIKPVRVEDYLAMTVRELQGTLALGSRKHAERASLKARGIECGPKVQQN
jgi:hypothetical protein